MSGRTMGPDPVHQVDSRVLECDHSIQRGETPSQWIIRITGKSPEDFCG